MEADVFSVKATLRESKLESIWLYTKLEIKQVFSFQKTKALLRSARALDMVYHCNGRLEELCNFVIGLPMGVGSGEQGGVPPEFSYMLQI